MGGVGRSGGSRGSSLAGEPIGYNSSVKQWEELIGIKTKLERKSVKLIGYSE